MPTLLFSLVALHEDNVYILGVEGVNAVNQQIKGRFYHGFICLTPVLRNRSMPYQCAILVTISL
jgi:hypothetical protein